VWVRGRTHVRTRVRTRVQREGRRQASLWPLEVTES
jgi:hypothetical protein